MVRAFRGWTQLLHLSVFLFLSLPFFTATDRGDVIHLKNGKQIEADRVWEENNKVCYEKDGGVYAFSKDLVKEVEVKLPSPAGSRDSADPKIPLLPKTLPIEFLDGASAAEAASQGNLIFQDGKIDYQLLNTLESEARRVPEDPEKRTAFISALLQIVTLEIQRGEQTEAMDNLCKYLSWKPDDLQAQLALGVLYLRQGNYSQAEDILSQARIKNENSADLEYLLGNSYYLQEKNELARRFLEHSLALKYRPEVEQLLRKIEGENRAEDNFKQANSLHFLVKYEGRQDHESLGTALLSSLEKSYNELETALDFSPHESIAVILYPDEVFRDITRTPNWVSALNDGKIRLPLKGITQIDETLKQMLKHELTHSFIRLKTGYSCPVWLNEGLAQVLAGESWRDFLPIFKKAASENKMPSLMSMERPFIGLSPGMAGWAYKQSALAVELIIKTYGMRDIQRLLDQAGKSTDFNGVLKSVLRSDYLELQKEIADYVASR